MKSSRVIFTGDIFRPDAKGGAHQEKNIKWLYFYFKNYFKFLVPDCQLECVYWGRGGNFRPHSFYSDLGVPIDIYSWATIYFSKISSSNLDELINKYFYGNLVVGFEMPFFLLSRFEEYNIDYLNIQVSPIRFLDDLCLEMSSNNHFVMNVLQKYTLPDPDIFCSAGQIIASMSRKSKIFDTDTFLIVGQTFGDKSLICDGKFLNIGSFLEDILIRSRSYSVKLYKPHPYDDGSFFDWRVFDDNGFKRISGNVYQYLSQEALREVVGISSSTLFEAGYFEKHTRYYGKKYEPSPCIMSYFNSFAFWADVLESFGYSVAPVRTLGTPALMNTLRDSLDASWGGGGCGGLTDVRIAAKELEIENLKKSLSWRITAPLRKLKSAYEKERF